MNTEMIDLAEMRQAIETEAKEQRIADLQKKWQAERQAIADAHYAARRNLFQKIVPFVQGNHEITDTGALLIDGVEVTYQVELVEEKRRHRGFRAEKTGKTSVIVYEVVTKYNRGANRSYKTTQRKRYPERKDGGHNYREIAEQLQRYADWKNAEARARDNRIANEHTAETFNTKNGLKYSSFDVTPSTGNILPLRVEFKLNRNLSVETAQKLHDALKALELL